MSKGYEERYLMTLLSAVLNQKASPEPLRRLNWEKMYRLSDYHRVAHVVYYGIIGLNEEIPQQIRQQFFDKYLEAVFRAERLRAGEKEIRGLLERKKCNCFMLDYSDLVNCYPIEEMCCCNAIEIGIERKSIGVLKRILEEADFEEKRSDEDRGRIYYRVPGIRILSYDYTLFFSRRMRRYFKGLMTGLPFRKGFQFVRQLTADDAYLFYMSRLTDSYARGEISLNQILNFWIFYKKYAETLSWPHIYERLKVLKIAEFAERLENLILRWFGTGASVDNMEIYDAMESYILSKGTEGREISSKLLPLIKTVADCYARNRRAEKLRKLLDWTFPDRSYMETIYPILERFGWLLPCFWLMRLCRYGLRFVWRIIEERLINKVKSGFSKIIAKVPFLNKIHIKRRKNENTDQESDQGTAEATGEQPQEGQDSLLQQDHEGPIEEKTEIPK